MGLLVLFEEKEPVIYSFVEIQKNFGLDIIKIPNEKYICNSFKYEDINILKDTYSSYLKKSKLIILSEIIEENISDKMPSFEIQILK